MKKLEICKLIISTIKDFISTPDRLEAFRIPNFFVRKRKLSMLNVILFLLYNGKSALQSSISSVRDLLHDITDFPKSITKQAISRARKGISFKLFLELFSLSSSIFYNNLKERKTWNGYHIFAIDGSKLELPNSKDNFDYFGEMFEHHTPERKYSQALASVVYDVLEDYIVHASCSRYLASEREQAIKHMQELEELSIYENSIIIFDRGYYSERLFRYCADHDHLCVMRLKDSYLLAKNLKKSKASAYEGFDTLYGDQDDGTEDIPIRVIAVKLDTGETEYLATNIFDDKITPKMFRELYFKRWPVESKYHELKGICLLEEFSGANVNSIIQEFYITLLISNLSALIKEDADDEIAAKSRSTNKHRYQSNRTFIIGRIRILLLKIISGTEDISVLITILDDACLTRSQKLPGRKFKRDMKKQKKRSHFRNRKQSF